MTTRLRGALVDKPTVYGWHSFTFINPPGDVLDLVRCSGCHAICAGWELTEGFWPDLIGPRCPAFLPALPPSHREDQHDMSEQLDLFPEMTIEPTIAMKRGDAMLVNCRMDGTLVYVPTTTTATAANKVKTLGPCPVCGGRVWSKTSLGEGPFKFRPDVEQEVGPAA